MRERRQVGSWAEEIALRATGLRADLGRGPAIGISGVDCAGKSTLAQAVADRLAAEQVAVVLLEGDEFTRPTAERYAQADEGAGYYRDSFDYRELFRNVLPAVRRSFRGDLPVRVTDWAADGWKLRNLDLSPAAVVIVDGCFLFAEGAARNFDLSVWVELPLERIVPRALQRPRDLRRMGGPDGVRSRYRTRYIPGQQLHLEQDRPQDQADIVFHSR